MSNNHALPFSQYQVDAETHIDISIIIPVHNEERRIVDCLQRTMRYCSDQQWDFKLIVAEDGSTDDTVKLVNDFSRSDKRIKLVSSTERLGKGGAIKKAIQASIKSHYIGYMDVDLAADPSEFQRLLAQTKNTDIVIGSRILRGDLPPIQRPLRRSIFSYAFSITFRTLFKIPIYDPQCGFKLFTRDAALRLFSDITTSGFAFDSEIIVKAFAHGMRVKEVPIMWQHIPGSKINVIHQINEMGKSLLKIWCMYHLIWLQGKPVYPQKKGSLKGRLLFKILAPILKPEVETRDQKEQKPSNYHSLAQ